jgi:hypothetical protein
MHHSGNQRTKYLVFDAIRPCLQQIWFFWCRSHHFFLCVHRLSLWIHETNYHRAELDIVGKPKIVSIYGW